MTYMDSPSVSVGFAVYNEEESVRQVLTEAYALLSSSDLEYEILVCNDGSRDRSQDIIESLASQLPHLRIIHHLTNLGINASFEHLYKEAKKDLVFINSTDKQWNTAILFDMLPLIKESDIIIASRKKKPYGLGRKFISWLFNSIPPILFGVRTYDAGAVKLIKREIIERFTLVSKSPFSEAERLIRATKAGYRIVDYPVDVLPRMTGYSHCIRPAILLNAFADVLRVWHSIYCQKDKRIA